MVNEGDFVAVFKSIHRVMQAEKVLKGRQLAILLIPAPRAVAADCGLAIRYAAAARAEVERVLREERLLPEEIYLKRGEEYVKCEVIGDLGEQ